MPDALSCSIRALTAVVESAMPRDCCVGDLAHCLFPSRLQARCHSHNRPAFTKSASLAGVRLTMSLSRPSGSRSRYMSGHLASGTMRGSSFEARRP